MAATVRFAVAPPTVRTRVYQEPAGSDPGAEWFAEQFARAYFGWTSNPAARDRALAAFVGVHNDPDGGVIPAPNSAQQIVSVGIAREGVTHNDTFEYIVAVQTTRIGLLYLDVDVARDAYGRYLLVHFPAIVAAPLFASTGALDGAGLPVLANQTLTTLLTRALRNYLGDSPQGLETDLVPGAKVASPTPALELDQVQRLAVEPSGVILATVVARDRLGDSYTLGYTVGVVLRAGQWKVSAIGPTNE